MPRSLAPALVENDERAVAVHRRDLAATILDDVEFDVLDRAVHARLVLRRLFEARGSADVERAHRELRARLADTLRGDDADGLADVDGLARGEVASVTLDADAAARLACQNRAYADALHAAALNLLSEVFVDLVVRGDDDAPLHGVNHVVVRRAAHDAVAQTLDLLAALDDGRRRDALQRAAVRLGDDNVLRHVNETARQIAGVGCLQRRVGETFARAVRRDEVLQHVQTFAEVRANRRLDDLARRLRHEAAHSGELSNLLRGSARARLRHDEDGVGLLRLLLALVHGEEHLLGDLVRDLRPDGDDLVVALAVRDDAVAVLLLDLDHVAVGLRHQSLLGVGRDEVVNAYGDSGARGVEEAELLEVVDHLHSHLVAEAEVAVVDERLEALLLQGAVDVGQPFGNLVVEDDPAHGRVDDAAHVLLHGGAHHVLRVVLLG